MDALKHKVHTAYKVRMPDRSSLQTPISLPPAARPSIFSVSFQMGWGARYALLTHPRTALSPPSTQGVAESLMTTRTTSAFLEKGVVTPEEFVVAGDYLVAQCPTWSWQGGDPKSAKSYLPDDKQFLVTRSGVLCDTVGCAAFRVPACSPHCCLHHARNTHCPQCRA